MSEAEARAALAYWDNDGSAPALISHRENAVYEVRLADGRRAALRLHRPGYNSAPEIASELWWMQALAARGFPVPTPVAARSGDLTVPLAGDRLATMLDWATGAPLGSGGEPLGGTLAEQEALYRQVGVLLARFHDECDALVLPADFTRRDWNIDGFLGEEPLWGRFWDNPALSASDRAVVLQARAKARADLADYLKAGADCGLIHADGLRENIFRDGDTLTLIDFDDAGFGFRLYDLATAVSQAIDDPSYPSLTAAVLQGYASARPLDRQAAALMPLFAMLRCFASLGWVMPRLAPDHPQWARSAERAVRTARAYSGA